MRFKKKMEEVLPGGAYSVVSLFEDPQRNWKDLLEEERLQNYLDESAWHGSIRGRG